MIKRDRNRCERRINPFRLRQTENIQGSIQSSLDYQSDRAIITKKNQGFVKLKQVERHRGTISEMDQSETSIHNQIHRGKLEKFYNTEV